jgi:lipid-A-disaccharide synthase
MIIVYRASPISYMIGRLLIRVPFIGLVNLVAGERVVPELIQNRVTPRGIAEEALAILEDGQRRESMVQKLKLVRDRMGTKGASKRAARLAVGVMERGQSGPGWLDGESEWPEPY